MTKGSIDRLGNQIRAEYDELKEDTLLELQEYRISHKDTIARLFNILCNINRKNKKDYIITYRIKRFESIIGKLYRYPKMQFSRMWDIGGCRCIVNNNEEVYHLKNQLEQNPHLNVRKVYDYIENPQPEGYKSLHLFISLIDDDKVIELQIRNKDDHNWATLVEITDLLFDAKLKEFGKHKDLLRFHFLLSKRFDLSFIEKKEVSRIIKKYKYFEKLSDVFTRNYIEIRKQWLEIESKHNHNYFLIETKKDEVPRISTYKKFDEAEENYFRIYKNNQTANIVLTHLPKPNYEQISIAYSNYILTFHSFLDDCYEIFENLIVKSLLDKQYFLFFKNFTLYNEIVYNHIKNLASEANELKNFSNKNIGKSNKYKLKQKERDWVQDINNQLRKRQEKHNRLQVTFRQNMPKSFFRKYSFTFIIKIISLKYRKKLQKAINETSAN